MIDLDAIRRRLAPSVAPPSASVLRDIADDLLVEVERLRALLARVPHLEPVPLVPMIGAVSEHMSDTMRAECARLGGTCAMGVPRVPRCCGRCGCECGCGPECW
jgi:hypothetical protein